MLRKLDKVHRICIPQVVMKMSKLNVGDLIEIYMSYGDIYVLPFDKKCDFRSKPQVGMIRIVGNMNRVAIPAEYVKLLQLKKGDMFDVNVDASGVIILKLM